MKLIVKSKLLTHDNEKIKLKSIKNKKKKTCLFLNYLKKNNLENNNKINGNNKKYQLFANIKASEFFGISKKSEKIEVLKNIEIIKNNESENLLQFIEKNSNLNEKLSVEIIKNLQINKFLILIEKINYENSEYLIFTFVQESKYKQIDKVEEEKQSEIILKEKESEINLKEKQSEIILNEKQSEMILKEKESEIILKENEIVNIKEENNQLTEKIKNLNEKFEEILSKNEKNEKEHNKNLGSIVHDLRTPLMGINFMIEKAKKETNAIEREKYLNFALNNSGLLNNLINDILDKSQIQENKIRLQISRFKVNKVLDDVYNLMKISAEMKGITLILDNKIAYYKVMVSDERRIKQILINFISNAIKFTIEGHVKIEASASCEDNLVHISVSDTGLGIPEENIEKLGMPFATFDNEKGVNKAGIGLGLNICKKLIGYLGPQENFKISSKVEGGSIFSFTIFKKMKKVKKPEKLEKKSKTIKFDIDITKSINCDIENNTPQNLENENLKKIKKSLNLDRKSSMELKISDRLKISSKETSKNEEMTLYSSDDEVEEKNIEEINNFFPTFKYCQNKYDDNDGGESPAFRNIKKMTISKSFKINSKSKRNVLSCVDLEQKDKFIEKFGPKLKSMSNINSPTKIKSKKKNTSLKILILDDIKFNLMILEELILQNKKYRINITQKTNSLQAFTEFKNCNSLFENDYFDLIISDLEMPILDGYEFCTKINDLCESDNFRRPVIIAYSSHIDEDVESRCFDVGFDAILEKPATSQEITDIIEDLEFFD